jgi:hypothetical protein
MAAPGGEADFCGRGDGPQSSMGLGDAGAVVCEVCGVAVEAELLA